VEASGDHSGSTPDVPRHLFHSRFSILLGGICLPRLANGESYPCDLEAESLSIQPATFARGRPRIQVSFEDSGSLRFTDDKNHVSLNPASFDVAQSPNVSIDRMAHLRLKIRTHDLDFGDHRRWIAE
jgi:hypothetical protein